LRGRDQALDPFFAGDPLSPEDAAVEHDLPQLREIEGVDLQARHHVRIAGPVEGPGEIGDSERLEELLADELIEPLPGRPLHDAGEEVHGFVVIEKLGTGRARDLGGQRELHEVGARVDLLGGRVGLEPGRVIEQVPQRDTPLRALLPLGVKCVDRLVE
jgi:hypothetical protein